MLNFGNGDTEFPLPSSATRAWSARSEKEKKKNLSNELWPCHCRNRGRKKNLWQCIVEIGEGKKKWLPKSEEELKK